MRLPRDISGEELAQALRVLGYEVTRDVSGHLRLTTEQGGQHHVSVPKHKELRTGTLSGVIGDVARHFGMSKNEVCERVFGSR